MIPLPDVNVLVALAWPNHVHHAATVEWFDSISDAGWSTCPLTESGFIRVSSNPRISGGTVTPHAAQTMLSRMVDVGDHTFVADDVSLAADEEAMASVQGFRQVTNAHLLALCRRTDRTLVTFDRGAHALDRNRSLLLSS